MSVKLIYCSLEHVIQAYLSFPVLLAYSVYLDIGSLEAERIAYIPEYISIFRFPKRRKEQRKHKMTDVQYIP